MNEIEDDKKFPNNNFGYYENDSLCLEMCHGKDYKELF